MNLYERWKEDGMRVLCDKDALKIFEGIGYTFEKCPCEYTAPEVEEVVAELPVEEVIPEVVDTDKQAKRGRKSKGQEEVAEAVEDKVTGPDIVL